MSLALYKGPKFDQVKKKGIYLTFPTLLFYIIYSFSIKFLYNIDTFRSFLQVKVSKVV